MDNFFNLPKDTQRFILTGAEEKLNVRSIILEKDIWICWILKELFELPIEMSFKGGTSLSKGYGLIKRFSEDVDVTLDYRNFISEPFSSLKSKTAIKKLSETLKENVKRYAHQTLLPYIKKRLDDTFPNENFRILLSENGEQLRIFYPSVLNMSHTESYLQSFVFIEFGGRNITEPNETRVITSLLSLAVKELTLPIAQVKVLSPLRTFWEKATLIHVECCRGRLKDSPDRLFRHWYDLALLTQSWVGQQALKNRELFISVIEHKKFFFNASYARYDDCLNNNFRLIPFESELTKLKEDFLKMQDAGMFSEEPPTFQEIVGILRNLEQQINQL